ncbi:uncharacterized protein N7529_008854 [Penicillium soppii]|uniref:uncharacterized protein n=1 Tax=Penicillium soppii TaxID=69789 RepID=UPI002547F63D|nr:uncharacterized protein N7529_008854 [Penicillium soppii]KAJ5861544.1 hypothetical protein N7529_008854 [Penicillium soppii]
MGTQVVETGAPAFQVPPLSILPAKSTQEGFTQVPTPIITCQAYETRKRVWCKQKAPKPLSLQKQLQSSQAPAMSERRER